MNYRHHCSHGYQKQQLHFPSNPVSNNISRCKMLVNFSFVPYLYHAVALTSLNMKLSFIFIHSRFIKTVISIESDFVLLSLGFF